MKEKPGWRVRDAYEAVLDFVEMQVPGFVCSMDLRLRDDGEMGFGLSQNKAQMEQMAPLMCRGLSCYVETRSLSCAEVCSFRVL